MPLSSFFINKNCMKRCETAVLFFMDLARESSFAKSSLISFAYVFFENFQLLIKHFIFFFFFSVAATTPKYPILHNNYHNCMNIMANHCKCLYQHFEKGMVNYAKKGKASTYTSPDGIRTNKIGINDLHYIPSFTVCWYFPIFFFSVFISFYRTHRSGHPVNRHYFKHGKYFYKRLKLIRLLQMILQKHFRDKWVLIQFIV